MKSWYSISAKANNATTEISIFDEIGYWGISAKQFINDLKSVDPSHNILLRIHSPGGEVFDGNAIYNALKRHPGGVTVQIEGLAASMATVIALAGSPVRMAANGFYMIHNPWGVALGDAGDMREQADLLDKIQTGIVNAYVAKSGKTAEQVQAWMDAETWFTAEEALAAGFVDEITESLAIAASANKFARVGKFMNAPDDLTSPDVIMDQVEETPEVIEEIPAAEIVAEVAADEVEETPETPVDEVPETPVAVIAGADSIMAKFNAVSAERDAFKAKAEKAEADLAAERLALSRLESSLGVAAAKVVPAVEQPNDAPNVLTRDQFAKLEPAAKSAFLKTGGNIID